MGEVPAVNNPSVEPIRYSDPIGAVGEVLTEC